ncbi:MAG: Hsp20 family protein [Hyphomicrobium sp.]
MRHTDFTPFYRSGVGFDRFIQMLDQVSGHDSDNGFPPYNIERTGENSYRITMAVAGFADSELSIEAKDTTLTVAGQKKAEDKSRSYLHRGIATRSFERRFQLADFVEVQGATFENGLLNIDLVRNLPERMKPRQIAISAGGKVGAPLEIDAATIQ